jgi:hypothetical protein
MLCVRDADTGERVALARAAGARLLRVCARLDGDGERPGLGDVHVLLVADLLRRTAESLHAAQVVTALVLPDRPGACAGAWAEALGPVLDGLRMPAPATVAHSVQAAAAQLGRAADVLIEPAASAAAPANAEDRPPGAVRVAVGPVHTPRERGVRDDRLTSLDAGESAAAVRLALLSAPYAQPVTLTRESVALAEDRLRAARRSVAAWACQPCARIPRAGLAAIREAFDDDMDAAAALSLLRRLEADPTVSHGAKFESFLYADRVFGLDLPAGLAQGSTP